MGGEGILVAESCGDLGARPHDHDGSWEVAFGSKK